MDTRLQEGIIGFLLFVVGKFLLFVVGKENQTANFICKCGNSLMCKTVVRSALPFFFLLLFFLGGGGGGAWHTCHCNSGNKVIFSGDQVKTSGNKAMCSRYEIYAGDAVKYSAGEIQ